MRIINLIIIATFIGFSCNRSPREVIIIDPNTVNDEATLEPRTQYSPLKVAASAILSPQETFESYEMIFDYISEDLGVPIEFHQRRTYAEINNMLETGHLDFAFICAGAYVELDKSKGLELLAIPVSSGVAFYNAYIITQKSFVADSFEDLRNATFAFSDPISNTGYFYPKFRLKEMGETPETFFGSTMFSYAHDISIQLVAKGVVEAASVNKLIYDYIAIHYPERIEEVKIIEVSPPFGNPPVVVSNRMEPEKMEQVRKLLLSMHENQNTQPFLRNLLIDRFIEGDDSYYEGLREMTSYLKND